AACAFSLIGPATALAECNTLVSCTVETVDRTVDDTVAFVNQKVKEAEALAIATLNDAQRRANAGLHVCVIQARIKPDGTGTGVADCASRYADNPTAPQKVHSDSVAIQGARVLQTPTGPQVSFAGATNPIVFTADNGRTYGVASLNDLAGAGGLSAHTGQWFGLGPGTTAAAAFHTLAGGPFGAPGDHFINGAIVLEGVI
ncbi:MAG TPA: hypothetical protein VHF89_05795, partial [Solirubrobacteraceae bacterium]|nr:hypothetical protein [Solirubrobacteraceae bacterium]